MVADTTKIKIDVLENHGEPKTLSLLFTLKCFKVKGQSVLNKTRELLSSKGGVACKNLIIFKYYNVYSVSICFSANDCELVSSEKGMQGVPYQRHWN